MKLASFNVFKKQPKKSDQAHLCALAESRFKVDQFTNTNSFTKGKVLQPRVLAICEDSIKIIAHDESEIFEEIAWLQIQQFNLKDNWTEWEIVLKDKRKFFFKCDKAFEIHLATDHILDGLISNNRTNDFRNTEF
ncbi:hypothetical protein DICPUDRAFT_92174 [Dictyostelium purpureum]|uniref:Uncharacterized protein n=1 Tax=Dictyostelium purpureum TaxID=5786 RepID=F0ZN21_DICPU|nr:uncharacterized protein DICPUDRAFT_92174 [Dictyostelium purpureum]EGC34682.1 hypothetical protein DICPUDRAFT_92174 [Dictyostelium purpureum]|eukprot:XP_003288819.1 hypothetical protein DICPUDRAFT_92174 [Dictyostelium purpureum]